MTEQRRKGPTKKPRVASGVLSIRQAADFLSITERYAYRLVKEGRFPVPVVRVGTREYRVGKRELLRYLAGEYPNDPKIYASLPFGDDTADLLRGKPARDARRAAQNESETQNAINPIPGTS